ncbi:hypothetical protein L207DRAFT_491274 [Hyaloscypha variabilis F]|uniref:Uncharacterized protein n=1 Tax=Hyaloscypha variabilis (strain UAMH 11265 / GT02V1 / F) TaxID=1149755 RepID=A0A2J6RL96_HYAVF|nr:hypothetical protein L207DRAFT_491274 [Hyaloscypha variabilis F]
MLELRDRIAAIDRALQEVQEVEISRPGTPVRHSLDHRFDKTDPDVDAAPAPTPSQEKTNPFESLSSSGNEKKRFYDSVAAAYGLGILDEDEFVEYVVYDAFITNLRICPVNLTDEGHFYYVEHRSFLPHVPGVILRRGTDKHGKSLGVAHIPLTGANTFGVGDFEARPQDMVWEKMANKGFWTHMKYEFVHELPGGETKAFHWIRTRNNIIDDQGDLVLVEDEKEQLVLAEYLGKGLLKWKKRGRLRIRDMPGFGEKWELVVLLTWASVVELSRRRARMRRYSPTHLIGT